MEEIEESPCSGRSGTKATAHFSFTTHLLGFSSLSGLVQVHAQQLCLEHVQLNIQTGKYLCKNFQGCFSIFITGEQNQVETPVVYNVQYSF